MDNTLSIPIKPIEQTTCLQDVDDQLTLLKTGILHLDRAAGPGMLHIAFRAAHGLKTIARAMGQADMAALAHALEALLEAMRETDCVTPEATNELLGTLETLQALRDQTMGVQVPVRLARLCALKERLSAIKLTGAYGEPCLAATPPPRPARLDLQPQHTLTSNEAPLTEQVRVVAIGELIASAQADNVLVAYGLGSCVAVCLYDPAVRVGGMLHALLPSAPADKHGTKFVDQGVPHLIEQLVQVGARRTRLQAKLCGGAQILTMSALGQASIGAQNVLAAEAALQAAGLDLLGRDTGGQTGRTVKLYLADGRVSVKTLARAEPFLI